MYFKGAYLTLGFEDPLIHAASRQASTILGGIFERDGQILFELDARTGQLELPTLGRDRSAVSLAQLVRNLASKHLEVSIDFVYAVFEEEARNRVSIYYRGQVRGDAPEGSVFIDLSAIPFEKIGDPACRSMLVRYVNEAKQRAFAIYMGTETEGVVRPVG